MNQLWVLMILSLGLAWIHEHTYLGTPDQALSKQKISAPFIIMVLVLGGFLGLRTSYNDTFTYRHLYALLTTLPEFWKTFNPSLSSDPGFNICNAILKTWGVSTQSWLMIYSLVTVGLYLHFVRKNRNNLILNVFLFFCVGCYTFAGAAIKQSIATAICLCALPFAVEKKWIRYFLLIALASTFHFYAVIYMLVPWLMFRPWTNKTMLLMAGTVVIGFSMRNLLGAIVSITSSLGESYDIDSFNGAGVNIFRILVCNAPVLLALLYHDRLFKDSTRSENLMFNLSMVNGCIMFIGLFGTANYFARLANFFVAAQAITLPWMLGKLPNRDRKIITAIMIGGYLLYFYYSSNVVYGTFSSLFKRISVGEFLQQLF